MADDGVSAHYNYVTDQIELKLDVDSAQWLADIVWEEYAQTRERGVNSGEGDKGAFEIYDLLLLAMRERETA